MNIFIKLVCACLLLTASVTVAMAGGEDRQYLYHHPSTMGEVTRDWLELQREGQQASASDQSHSPRVQDRLYQRYLDSYRYPIPENFYSPDRFRETR